MVEFDLEIPSGLVVLNAHFRAQKVFDEMSEPLIPEIRDPVPRYWLQGAFWL